MKRTEIESRLKLSIFSLCLAGSVSPTSIPEAQRLLIDEVEKIVKDAKAEK